MGSCINRSIGKAHMILILQPFGFDYSGRAIQNRQLSNILSTVDRVVIPKRWGEFLSALLKGWFCDVNNTIVITGVRKALVFSIFFKLFGFKVIYQMTNFDYDDPLTLKHSFFSYFFMFVDCLVAQAPGFEKVNEKVLYINNLFTLQAPVNRSSRSTQAVHIGAICQRKRQIEAALYAEKNQIPTVFVGPSEGFFEEDSTYVNEFLSFIEKSTWCKYLGKLDQNEVFSLYCLSKWFFVASANEGSSNYYIEALSFGLEPLKLPGSDTRYLDSLEREFGPLRDLDFNELFFNKPSGCWKDLVKI